MPDKRLFIASPLPDSYLEVIKNFRDQQEDGYRWIEPENWHMTILFLGDFPEEHIDNLKHFLSDFFQKQTPLTLKPKSFIFAPKLTKARMIWLNFFGDESYDQLVYNLFDEIKSFYENIGIEFNLSLHKRNIPHVTLARFKPFNAYNNAYLQQKHEVRNLSEIELNEAILFKSELTQEGANYKQLDSYSFG